MVFLVSEIPREATWWRNSFEIWRWCRQYTLISPTAHQNWLDKIEIDPSIKMFGIRTVEPAHPGDNCDEISQSVGVCGFTSIDKHNQRAEFSLYIGREHHRKGYATEALRLLLRHGFQAMNFIRIWGEVFEGNPAMKMFKNLGMQEEGRLRQSYFRNGKFIDSIIVSILRSEWDASCSTSTNLFDEPSVSGSDYYDAQENIARARPLHR